MCRYFCIAAIVAALNLIGLMAGRVTGECWLMKEIAMAEMVRLGIHSEEYNAMHLEV